MKSSKASIQARQAELLAILSSKNFIKIDEIASTLQVSPLTIRRDLDELAQEYPINRFYGGASLGVNSSSQETDENIFSSSHILSKQSIARYAATLVEDGDTIFINTSSTAAAMLPYIQAKQVTIITNNMHTTALQRPEDSILLLTGGELRLPKEAMVGDFAANNIAKVSASKCFLGCNGITVEEGVTTGVFPEAAVNTLMLTRVTGPRYILGDKSKIGRNLNFIYGDLSEITCLITDSDAPEKEIMALKEHIDVVQVNPKTGQIL